MHFSKGAIWWLSSSPPMDSNSTKLSKLQALFIVTRVKSNSIVKALLISPLMLSSVFILTFSWLFHLVWVGKLPWFGFADQTSAASDWNLVVSYSSLNYFVRPKASPSATFTLADLALVACRAVSIGIPNPVCTDSVRGTRSTIVQPCLKSVVSVHLRWFVAPRQSWSFWLT